MVRWCPTINIRTDIMKYELLYREEVMKDESEFTQITVKSIHLSAIS